MLSNSLTLRPRLGKSQLRSPGHLFLASSSPSCSLKPLIQLVLSASARRLLTFLRETQAPQGVGLRNTLLVCVAGTANTSVLIMYSRNFDSAEMLFKRINFSSATSPLNFQEDIEPEVDSKIDLLLEKQITVKRRNRTINLINFSLINFYFDAAGTAILPATEI
jgi:hypothetical protein